MRWRQSRSVALLYGGIAGALLVVVASVALIVAPPSPPSVAEFAPGAMDTIEDAPEGQPSRFGAGDGGCPSGLVCDPTTGEVISADPGGSVAARVDRARIRRCVGDPPRQIEDPQSPPCVNYWEGDNGGSTWKGVTRDEIRVAYHDAHGQGEGAFAYQVTARLVEFFNRRFELYGRRIKLVLLTAPYGRGPAEQRAAAAKADEELKVFASLGYSSSGSDAAYYDELARRDIMSFTSFDAGLSYRTEDDFRRSDPFAWSVMVIDKLQRNGADWICSGLVGRPARFGGPDVQASRRYFGVLLDTNGGKADSSALTAGLTGCGVPHRVVEFDSAGSGDDIRSESAKAAMADLKVSGVTSLICFCFLRTAMQAASDVYYTPEWILMDGRFDALWPREQRLHLFGITPANKVNGLVDRPSYWALKESDPDYVYNDNGSFVLPNAYRTLLLLASGIQMAGPNLTPYNFRDALLRTRFPNPGAGAPPYYQATVGFRRGDHSMFRDFAMVWWDDAAQSNYRDSTTSVRGAFCYVGKGSRYTQGSWPGDDSGLFDRSEPCA